MSPLRVRILGFDGMEALDFAGPFEVFTTASRELAERTARQMDFAWTQNPLSA